VLTYGNSTVRSRHVCDSIYICFADTKSLQSTSITVTLFRIFNTNRFKMQPLFDVIGQYYIDFCHCMDSQMYPRMTCSNLRWRHSCQRDMEVTGRTRGLLDLHRKYMFRFEPDESWGLIWPGLKRFLKDEHLVWLTSPRPVFMRER
jgi:hypothetical protein